MFQSLKLIQKTVVDLENYNFNKYLIIITILTLVLSLGTIFCIYFFLFETLIESKNYESQIPLVNTIYNSYIFYLLTLTFKVLLGFTILGLVMIPIGTIITGIFADKIFDILNKKRNPKYKFKRKPNSLYLSLRYSIGCSIRTILVNILIIPLYFFLPLGNLLIFIFINGFFISREFLGNFLVQFHDHHYIKKFFLLKNTELYFIGCAIAFLYTIPLVNFFIPFICNVLFANMILDNKFKI
mgnify:CR=1 FL=1